MISPGQEREKLPERMATVMLIVPEHGDFPVADKSALGRED
jgi:hypothetical protein